MYDTVPPLRSPSLSRDYKVIKQNTLMHKRIWEDIEEENEHPQEEQRMIGRICVRGKRERMRYKLTKIQ